MKTKQTKKNGFLSVLCYIAAALFLVYGIYMVIYALDYIRSYESTGLINMQSIVQYVVTSSASYFGFAILLFVSGSVVRMLRSSASCQPETPEEGNPPETASEDAPEAEIPADTPVQSGCIEPDSTPEPELQPEPIAEPQSVAEPESQLTEETEEIEETEEVEEIREIETIEDSEAKKEHEDLPPVSEQKELPIPAIGNTSSALTFQELAIASAKQQTPKKEEIKPIEKISSSMIRDIFEHK